jgi:hypothetical protein
MASARSQLLGTTCAALLAVPVLAMMSGCGSDNMGNGAAVQSTATVTPTATPTPRENENIFGATEVGGGTLTIDAPLGPTGQPTVDIYLSNSVGGTDIYIGTTPGFKEADADEPNFPLYQLVDGIPITLEVVAIDPAVSLIFEEPSGALTLTQAGQSIPIGTTPGIQQDLSWQVQVPSGGSASGHSVMVQLTTTSDLYSESAVYTLQLVPMPGQPPSG